MSAEPQQIERAVEDEQCETESDDTTDEPTRHPDYEETTRSCYSSQSDARSAFREMLIKPSRVQNRSKLRKRFERTAFYHYANSVHCYQWPRGAGLIERTNRQNRGDVQLRAQDGTTVSQVSASGILDLLSEVDITLGLSQIVTQHTAETDYGSTDTTENSVIEFEDGHYIVILYDASANAREGSNYAGMFLANDDPRNEHVRRYIERDAYAELSDIVAPDKVLASDLEIVDSSTYRSTGDRYAPDNQGGYGDEDALGEMIVRQGEWYFIPQPDLEFDADEIEKPLSEYDDDSALGSHVSRDQVVDDDVYVRGTVRHNRNEHSMFNLYDMWHKVVENTADMFVFETRSGGRWE